MGSRGGDVECWGRCLRQEMQVLNRLVYKNRSQHRHASYFQSLLQVQRLLNQLLDLSPPEDVFNGLKEDCARGTQPPINRFAVPGGALRRAWEWMLHVHDEILPRLLRAARQLAGLMAQGFFLPLAVTFLCALARSRSLLLKMVHALVLEYNETSSALSPEARTTLKRERIPCAAELLVAGPHFRLQARSEPQADTPLISGLVQDGSAEGLVSACECSSPRLRPISSTLADPNIGAGSESPASAAEGRQVGDSLLKQSGKTGAHGNGEGGLQDMGVGVTSADLNTVSAVEGEVEGVRGEKQQGGLPTPKMKDGEKGAVSAVESSADPQDASLKQAMLDLGFAEFLTGSGTGTQNSKKLPLKQKRKVVHRKTPKTL